MIARRDQTIWDAANGQATRPVDDSADPPLPAIVSNVEPDSIRDTTVAETLQSFQLAPGYRANCFASEEQFPNLAKPCQMAVDARGRVWVVTMPSYPMYLPGDPLPNDKVLIYEDVDRDGVADKETVFAEGLHLPTGIELGHGGCYVASQPNLLFLKDTDGDDRADHSEIVAHGFDSADSHHSISALTWGPDGALYMAEGTFHHTQIESPYGPRRVANAAVFRFHPVNWRWDIFVSYGFANPWGQTFDDWGQYFVADASGGDNYFGTAFSGDVVYPNKHNRMRTFIDMQWRPTAGCELVSSRHFREQDQGNFLLNNCIGFQGVLQYRITEEESGFRGRPTTPLLQSSDRNFRPVDLEFGADGALYVVDWYNPLIGHMQHSIRDPHRDKSRGRLWRITCDENPTVPIVALDALTTDQLLDQLLEPEYRTRYRTRRELVARDPATVVAALDRWATGMTPGDPMASRRLIEALWLAESLDEFKPQLLDQALAWPDGRVRAAATRVLGNWRDRMPDALARLVSLAADPNPRVRLEAVRAASFFEGDAARRVADEALFRPMDDYLKYAYEETLRTLDHRAPSPVGSTAARLIARAQNEPLDEATLGRLLELVSERATADELQWVLDQATDERVPLAARRAAWRGLAAAARQRHCLATGFRDWAAKSLADAWPTDESISTSVVDLCGAWRIEEAVPQLSRLADATTAMPAAFRPIAQSLAEIGSEAALARLRELASKPGLAAPLREECLLALVAVGDAQGQRDVLLALAQATANDALADPGRVERAVQAFLSHPSGASQLADGMSQLDAADQLPTALALAIRRAIKRLGAADAELDAVVNRLAGIEPRGPLTDAEANRLARLVSQRGDAERGQEIFRRADLGCYKCHALGGAGGNVGPELRAIGTTSPVDYLIRAILAPDADVKESYKTRKFLTVEGRIVSGIVTRRDPGVVTVRQSDDTLVAIPTEDIDDEADGRSQMPDGIADELTDEQLADLVAFLHQLGRDDEANIPSTPRVLAWLAAADLPVGNGDVWAFDSTDGVWARPAYARIDGQLPLAELFQDLGAREQVRLVAGIDCTVGGNVQLKLHGDPVSLHWDSQAQEISANGTATVDCEPGVHWITIQVERPKSADAALTLELARADGSPIEFSVLGSAGLASSLAH
jgi:putative heme-binding domain-containing protein